MRTILVDVGSWLGGAAPLLLSGLIGAAVGVLGLFGVQGWQLRVAKTQAKAAARLIYLEITYNLAWLQASAAAPATWPVRLASGEWERHGGQLVSVMRENEIALVASPYIQADAYRTFFEQSWYYMVRHRLSGDDVEWLRRLHTDFAEAEKALRPKVWTGPRLSALAAVRRVDGDPFARPPLGRRLERAVGTVPMGVLSWTAFGLLVLRAFLEVGDWLRKTLGQSGSARVDQRGRHGPLPVRPNAGRDE